MIKISLDPIATYYNNKLQEYGTTSRGVDWKDESSHQLRFRKLLKLLPESSETSISLLDYGCGYAALLDCLLKRQMPVCYHGFDIAPSMLEQARSRHPQSVHYWYERLEDLTPVDYVVASGIFNVRLKEDSNAWESYILDTLNQFNQLSKNGFAFNALTSYSDPEYMRKDLHYSNPLILFDYCKRNFSRHVSLLHDYGLYEFTIIVRK